MLRPILLALAVALAATPGSATDCATWSTTNADYDVGGLYYADWDEYCFDFCFFPWIYEESNGIAGLQRNDEVIDDTCHGVIPADTIVF